MERTWLSQYTLDANLKLQHIMLLYEYLQIKMKLHIINRSWQYSNKYKEFQKRKWSKHLVPKCSSKAGQRNKSYPASYCEWFDFKKKVQFWRSFSSKYSKKRYAHSVESETDSSELPDINYDSSDSITGAVWTIKHVHSNKPYILSFSPLHEFSQKCDVTKTIVVCFWSERLSLPCYLRTYFMDATRLILHHQGKKLLYNIKLSKRVTKIHLVSQKAIRKMTKQPRYQIKHVTVMYESTVANISIYFVKSNIETLLSGNVCEELGIITFRP